MRRVSIEGFVFCDVKCLIETLVELRYFLYVVLKKILRAACPDLTLRALPHFRTFQHFIQYRFRLIRIGNIDDLALFILSLNNSSLSFSWLLGIFRDAINIGLSIQSDNIYVILLAFFLFASMFLFKPTTLFITFMLFSSQSIRFQS